MFFFFFFFITLIFVIFLFFIILSVLQHHLLLTVLLQILGQQSQAHDAVLAIMKGAMTLISNEETITADKLMPAIKNVSTLTIDPILQSSSLLRILSQEAVVSSCLMRMATESASQVNTHLWLPSLLHLSPLPLTASVYNMFPIIDLPGSPNDVSTPVSESVILISHCVCTYRSGTWPARGM